MKLITRLSDFTRLIFIFKLLVAISLFVSAATQAQQARIYSTEGYCILALEQVDSKFLANYEKKLGFRPKAKLCNRVNKLVSDFRPKNWSYRFGQAYPGSSIYLSPDQIQQIKQRKDRLTRLSR